MDWLCSYRSVLVPKQVEHLVLHWAVKSYRQLLDCTGRTVHNVVDVEVVEVPLEVDEPMYLQIKLQDAEVVQRVREHQNLQMDLKHPLEVEVCQTLHIVGELVA